MDHQDLAVQPRVGGFEPGAYLVAVGGVLGHDEEDRLLAGALQLLVGTFPLEIAGLQVRAVALDKIAALRDLELGLAHRVWHDRRLHHVLRDRLN